VREETQMQTIDDAIERLNDRAWVANRNFEDDEDIQLGIEALKAIKRAREGDPPLDGELLPGETEE
jgi:hypothetical protein